MHNLIEYPQAQSPSLSGNMVPLVNPESIEDNSRPVATLNQPVQEISAIHLTSMIREQGLVQDPTKIQLTQEQEDTLELP